MRWKICLFALAAFLALGTWAQESPNFKVGPSVFNAGGPPAVTGQTSPAFRMNLGSLGECVAEKSMASLHFRVSAGYATVPVETLTKPGDCDANGIINIGEIQKALNMFLGIQQPGCNVDCNGDGRVTIGEVQKVVLVYLGFVSGC